MSGSVDECIKDGIVSIDQVLSDHQTTAKSTIHTNVPSPFDLYAGSATPYTTTRFVFLHFLIFTHFSLCVPFLFVFFCFCVEARIRRIRLQVPLRVRRTLDMA